MTPERWQEVKNVLAGALERTPEEKRVDRGQGCTYPDLRREVETLIVAREQAGRAVKNLSCIRLGAAQSNRRCGG